MARLYNRLVIFISLAFSCVMLHGQDSRLVINANHTSPADFFMELSLQSGINIIYSDNVITRVPDITLQLKGVSVEDVTAVTTENSKKVFGV